MDSISLELTGGFRIVVPADARRLSTHVFLEYEDWFEDEAPFIRALIAPGERVLDIGANLGFYALSAARAAGPLGRIWAFEPTPDIARRLRASVALNSMDGISVIEAALGERSGTATLGRGANDELNRIVEPGAAGESVRIARLDDWNETEPAARDIGFVKLDVEGHETAVIAGGAAFFARESPLVMLEIADGTAATETARNSLGGLGYAAYRLLPEAGILVPHAGPRPDSGVLNMFMAKPDRAAALEARGLLARAPETPILAPLDAVAEYVSAVPALAAHSADLRRSLSRLVPDGPYATALRAFLAARDPAASAPARASALTLAFEAAGAAARERPSAARMLTAGRIARATGRRGLAADAAEGLVRALLRGQPMTLGEPFLPLLPDYETWTSPAGPQGWMSAMMIEAFWRWSGFSTYFHHVDFGAQDPATMLRGFGREAPFFERRAMLEARLKGQSPAPHPMLLRRGADNLNPEYWAGTPVVAALENQSS